ncbi:endoplasmic reticulum aminopeptidase 2-like isoform X2 [Nylanderia fulva]|uniref:endoplasmic reticulum aminopeptidase 2-like isoform X2 n=1 Tax=Nylanderia fulva TaxID=613905 RepID=UPI0010FB06F7|nr:endoplasmic reticulum aminopeptidase 2-like isoform X2 [Nylanderia fulva]
MIFLKLLLISSGLMFIPETASIRNESSLCYQPSKFIKPIHYDIKLITYIEGHIFYGEYNISISILNLTQRIFLQSEKLSIQDIVLFKNIKKNHENDNDTVYESVRDIKEDTIVILFINELLPGNYTLNIKYYGTFNEDFRIYDIKGKMAWVAAIHFHTIWPQQRSSCRDEQNLLLEATFNMSIGCNQCTALSNMPLQNEEENEYKMLWTHFATTSAMSPYLIRMIVSNFLSRIDNDNRNIEMWCNNKYGFYMKFAINFAENITLFLKNEWNSNVKVTHVAIPNFHDNDIIDFGIVFYKDTDIIYDKNLHSIAKKIEVAQLVGRKVTQQWFYNMLNNPLVSDFWFKKGLITYLATYAVKMTYPDYQIENLLVVQNQHYSFNLDSGYYMWNSTLQDNNSSEIPNSIRAPFIMRMMELSLEESSWNNILSYANSTTQSSSDFNNFTPYFLYAFEDFELSLPFKENGWMIFNIQRVGYYRVNYDDENWQRISNFLNSDNYMKIHVLNRAQIIDDAFHLMIAGQLNCHIFWDLIKYLHREEDYVAWYPMFKAMEYMYGTFPWKEMVGNVTFLLRYALYMVLERIKYEEIDDTDELRICLRQEAARWACFLDSPTCKKKANDKLEQHVQDPTKHKLLPWWQEWTYCNGLMITNNNEIWQLVYDIGYEKFNPKFIQYLACPDNANMTRDYLRFQSIRERENQYVLTYSLLHIITRHAKNQTTLRFILNDLLEVKPKHVDITAAIIIIINNVYSVNQTQEINSYVQRLKDIVHINVDMKAKDIITQNSDKIKSKISMRNSQIERQRQYFDSIFYYK